jgi:hypothetical protein
MMQYKLFLFGSALAVTIALAATAGAQTSAVTSKDKMETCKFGAADQKLTGKQEQEFIRKCMANEPAKKSTAKK